MKMIGVSLLVLAATYARGQDITGDWNGRLNTGGAELRLVLHVRKNADASLQATLDSIDQNVNGIPANAVLLAGSTVTLTLDAIHADYRGKLNADGSEITGTWTQGESFSLRFHRGAIRVAAAGKAVAPSDIDGDWLGILDTGMGKLRLVLHISNTEKGPNAMIDSLDQNAKGLPLANLTRHGASLSFEMTSVGGAYRGTIARDLSQVEGSWSQLGKSLPLVFKRVTSASEVERPRPQTPLKPYPYREEEVSYQNSTANIKLAGTLTIPAGEGPFPAVLLMAGSGPHDRDETIFGHKPFLVIADYLTRQGIVVLRADKRGVGGSGGNYASAVIEDFVSDADAGVAYLTTRPEVDARHIGLIGHSEGGIEAPMSAVRNPRVAFVVMLAGVGVPGDQLLSEQLRLIEAASGVSQDQIEKDVARQHRMLMAVERYKDNGVLEKHLRETFAGILNQEQLDAQLKMVSSPWFRSLLEYDPPATLKKLSCPVLVLNGEKDLQVPPDQNLPAIRKALAEAGNKNFQVEKLPGLNHLFQTAKTGAISEYAEIEETFSPAALKKVADWIREISSTGGFRTLPAATTSQ